MTGRLVRRRTHKTSHKTVQTPSNLIKNSSVRTSLAAFLPSFSPELCSGSFSEEHLLKERCKQKYLREQMLDDSGQRLHLAVPLDQKPPQLDDGLVLPLHLLFVLVLLRRRRSRSGSVLRPGTVFRAGPRPGSGFEPRTGGCSGPGCGAGAIRRWDWESWCYWAVGIQNIWYLRTENFRFT